MTKFFDMSGNIFASQSEVIVITVNCVGVMGAGIALDAKHRWPDLAEKYRSACSDGRVSIGKIFWASTKRQKIAFFPTKTHWKLPTEITFIEKGLSALRREIADKSIFSLALPHLGCSNGGLNWSDVQPFVRAGLSNFPKLNVELWEFNSDFVDDDFVRFKNTFLALDDVAAATWLMCSKGTVKRIRSALARATITNFVQISSSSGIGEKTIAKVYEAALRSHQPPIQGSFWHS